ncbi:MerR family transcriptional regulator [Streptomyces jumonjinensis]|uniref:Helix-turn-helix domain-containing protein n=1 Tax=Streptomyces jumonjinensis TaxID=1945 RepID=A0A646KSJ9_STRJU|nr:hypothetical protein [Streptomyces jumonjinensis]MQT05060.1 helix-turn-helix domain-containing protein [Streptomyces jumonjinensis]
MATALSADSLAADLGAGSSELRGLAALLRLLGDPEKLGQLLGALPGAETPEPRLHVGYEEAARRLNIPEKWLRERISTLPHRKLGKFVQFTEDDLNSISRMHFVGPQEQDNRASDSSWNETLKPSPRSRRRS